MLSVLNFEVNSIFWLDNEEAGFRQVKVRSGERVLAVMNANRVEGVWNALFVPMGFSFNMTEMEDLRICVERSEVLMKALCKQDLELDELENIINGFL